MNETEKHKTERTNSDFTTVLRSTAKRDPPILPTPTPPTLRRLLR